jgi:hypothetical protein
MGQRLNRRRSGTHGSCYNQVEEWVKAGIKVYSCYEAGACGYWYKWELIKCGAVNYVVVPRPLENQRSKHQKTDRLDARALLVNLERRVYDICAGC